MSRHAAIRNVRWSDSRSSTGSPSLAGQSVFGRVQSRGEMTLYHKCLSLRLGGSKVQAGQQDQG